jgi:hypothetical protein
MEESISLIKQLLPDLSRYLFTKPNVVATGIGYKRVQGKQTGNLCIICSVESKVADAFLSGIQRIPSVIEGILTDVQQTGLMHVMQEPEGLVHTTAEINPHTGRHRPFPGGISIGHKEVSAGTLGCLVKKEGKIYILSNNHVLANSNFAAPGDLIIQPGLHDGGKVAKDVIAGLSEFIPVIFENETREGNLPKGLKWFNNIISRLTRSRSKDQLHNNQPVYNLVDCAIAGPVNTDDCLNEILKIGKITGTAEGMLGMKIKKSGRTTGLTSGSIEQTDVTVRVNFGAGRTAIFRDQFIAGAMSQGGDSGSVVLDRDNKAVGLLFAGSANSTIINRIRNVFELLEIDLI